MRGNFFFLLVAGETIWSEEDKKVSDEENEQTKCEERRRKLTDFACSMWLLGSRHSQKSDDCIRGVEDGIDDDVRWILKQMDRRIDDSNLG